MTGKYAMISSSIPAEMDSTVEFYCNYSSHGYQSGDTIYPYIWFALRNTYPMAPGWMKISKNVTYKDANQSKAKIQRHINNITGGFYSDMNCKINNACKISGDTIILNFTVIPATGPQYSFTGKYKKI
jgi:hypothetical protein